MTLLTSSGTLDGGNELSLVGHGAYQSFAGCASLNRGLVTTSLTVFIPYIPYFSPHTIFYLRYLQAHNEDPWNTFALLGRGGFTPGPMGKPFVVSTTRLFDLRRPYAPMDAKPFNTYPERLASLVTCRRLTTHCDAKSKFDSGHGPRQQ